MNDKELRKRYETNKYDPNLGYVPPHIRNAKENERRARENQSYYNQQQNYTTSSYSNTSHDDVEAMGLLFLIPIVGAVAWYFFGDVFAFFNSYSDYSQPYKFVVAFYNYIIVVPIQTIPSVWGWFSGLTVTGSQIVNFIISVIGVFFYTVLGATLYISSFITISCFIIDFIGSGDDDAESISILAIGFFTAPAVIAMFWFLVTFLINLITSLF